MKNFSILSVLLALFFFSCGSGSDSETTAATTASPPAKPAYDNALAKGKVIDSVMCNNQNSQSFALYLPSYYTSDKKFPCIYFFDAHARGSLPVKTYKGLAEKYGFVLVGSNVSKNGTQWQVTNVGVKTLMADTRARINIDPQRIYTSGFSGGSRVASSVAIMDGGVAGVIGCAAGFPQVDQPFQNKFCYFGMVGDYDFNLTDMEQTDAALAQNGFAHQLLTFNGKHEWPPVSDFQTALLWIQANAMRAQVQQKNDTIIAALKNDYGQRIVAAEKSDDLVREHELLDGIISALGGIADVSAYQKQSAAIVAGNAYKNAVAAQLQLQQVEMNQQQELAKQFTAQNEKWWTGKIAELNKNVHSAKTQKESQMNKRLVNFIGLIGYLSANHALSVGDLANAAAYLRIFKMADPQNADCSYLTAVFYMKNGNRRQAIAALDEAASLGYCDVSQLVTDPVFGGLQNDAGFKNVLDKVGRNTTK